MSTRYLVPFTLEDFFNTYEHRSDLINLASSDAQPWSVADLRRKGVIPLQEAEFLLQYPDIGRHVTPGLTSFCNPPPGMGVLPTSGAAEAIALVVHALSIEAEGDHRPVAISQPSFGAFRGLAALMGLTTATYEYHPSRGWTPDVDELFALSSRCRGVVIVNPHNPTGYVFPRDVLAHIAATVGSHDGVLIVDEVFLVSGENASTIDLGEHVVVIGSLSKTYGLPGLRLGWVAANQSRIKRLRTLQQYLTLSLNVFTVAIGEAVLADSESFSRSELIRVNRRLVQDWVKSQNGRVSLSVAAGGTTACMTIKSKLGETNLFEEFLREKVLLVPGTRCFPGSWELPWFRIGYGCETATLERGLSRLSATIGRLDRIPRH